MYCSFIDNLKLETSSVSIRRINKLFYTYRKKCKFKNVKLICQETGMCLRHIKLNERFITQKSTYCVILFKILEMEKLS